MDMVNQTLAMFCKKAVPGKVNDGWQSIPNRGLKGTVERVDLPALCTIERVKQLQKQTPGFRKRKATALLCS